MTAVALAVARSFYNYNGIRWLALSFLKEGGRHIFCLDFQ
jgi:hypothetical protein